LDDPDNQKRGKLSSKETEAQDARRDARSNDIFFPVIERKGSRARVASELHPQNIPSGSEGSYETSANISFQNAREISQKADEATIDRDCYEDLTISSHSTHDTVSTGGEAIQQYKEQLGGLHPKSYEKRFQRYEDDSNDPLRQFEKDMAGLDLKLTMVTDDSEESVNDLEKQPPYNPATYQNLVGPIDPSQKINWKKSMYFFPCLLVLIGFVLVTPLVTDRRREESSAELVESSIQPTIAPPSPSPSWIEGPTPSPSKLASLTSIPTTISSSTFTPTQGNSTTESNHQCSAAEFPESELDLIFLPSYVSMNYCAVQPENLATFQRLECVGVDLEYRPAGFVPNRFRDTDGSN
jgi:hypothetical protein